MRRAYMAKMKAKIMEKPHDLLPVPKGWMAGFTLTGDAPVTMAVLKSCRGLLLDSAKRRHLVASNYYPNNKSLRDMGFEVSDVQLRRV